MVDVSRWPEVTITRYGKPPCYAAVTLTVPLPTGGAGRAGWHLCSPAVPSECESCREARDAADKELRAQMMAGAQSTTNVRAFKVDRWEV